LSDTWIVLGTVRPPKDCSCFYTYTARRTCSYAEQLGLKPFVPELVYKDLKTLLCRIYPAQFRAEIGDEECEFASCEAVMGKRGTDRCSGWAGAVLFRLDPKTGEVLVMLDVPQWQRLSEMLFGSKRSREYGIEERELIPMLIEKAVERLNEIYDDCEKKTGSAP